MKRSVYLALALLSIALAAEAQSTDPTKPVDPKACQKYSPFAPGGNFVLNNQGASTNSSALFTLTLTPLAGTTKDALTIAWTQTDTNTLTFMIPLSADGIYTIQRFKKTIGTGPAAKSEDLTDFSPQQLVVERPSITAVSPTAAFTNENHESSFAVLMRGLCPNGQSTATTNIQLHLSDISTPVSCDGDHTERCYTLKVDNPQQITLTFKKLDPNVGYYSGKKSFYLTVDGLDTAPTTLSLINTTSNMPITAALVGFVLILVAIYLLLRSGKNAMSQKMNGKTYWLSTLFFDQQTNSYSLSKCQFYAWTAASVIAYLFLAISKSYVQGSAVFPEIPSGLPGILLASVGTVVLSTGITSAKGDKGAGDPGPNLSDFIASGGVVAADRLQFAVWTLVGVGTFLALVFHSDPRNINDLPAIPTGFMQLMGISTAGYLGGKLARKAGPTISAIVLTTSAQGNPRFQITGSGLSRSATFSIDDKPIFPDVILGKDDVAGPPEIVQLDPIVGDPDFARVLAFSIKNVPDAWLGKDRKFTITNPDSQKATVTYQKFKITKITISPNNASSFAMEGECLDSPLDIHCTALLGAPGPANGPFNVDRKDGDKGALTYSGTLKKLDGTPTGLAAGDKLNVKVKDQAGFVGTWTTEVRQTDGK
jgi:hypothetical protein